jgi:hypothetical protein
MIGECFVGVMCCRRVPGYCDAFAVLVMMPVLLYRKNPVLTGNCLTDMKFRA